MSLSSFFEGPGDGTDGNEQNSALDAVDRAVGNGAVWINAAGNYGGGGWSVRDPQEDQAFIVFDTDDTGLVQKIKIDGPP